MAMNRGDLACDSCDTWFDGDVVALTGANTALAATLHNPANRKQVRDFWLCGDCAPDYPNGAHDWFSEVVWDDLPVCERCDYADVDEWGHVCDDCEDGII